MKRHLRILFILGILMLCVTGGWWLAQDAASVMRESRVPEVVRQDVPKAEVKPKRVARVYRDEFRDGTSVELFASSKPDEIILRFPSTETYQAFFYALSGSQVRLIDQLDRLNAMRLGYHAWEELAVLLDGENIIAYDSLPSVPPPAAVTAGGQEGLVGFGASAPEWLGIRGDHRQWGQGVRVAVIDSGVVPHPALPGLKRSIAITPFPEDLAKTYGHGTAVASLIAGNGKEAPGIAPAAELVSIRVGDESGKADSFALAAGILAALDEKVDLINISMGTTEDNPLVEEAVMIAHDEGALIVAASGNSAGDDACYPAAYPTVISVGAVDARGVHLDFSNYGTYLSLTAPGYLVNTAWPGGRYSRISGTSASAPIVTGAIAATMSHGGGRRLGAREAAEIVMNYCDEAGYPGPDSEYGMGILNMGRVMNRGVAGIVDGAITDQRIFKEAPKGGGGELVVTVQNRGTTVLVNALVEIRSPAGTQRFHASTLGPGKIQTFSVPLRLGGLPRGRPVEVTSQLSFSSAREDVTTENNQRTDLLVID